MSEVKEKKVPVLVAEIADKRPTNFILEGSEETGSPVRMETSHARKLKPVSSIMVRKKIVGAKKDEPQYSDWEVRRIRYIKGCSTIYVDEQEQKGFKPNGAQDAIWIENGSMHVARDAANKSYYDYVLYYEGNANFPVSETMMRPENAIDVYKLLDTETEAVVKVDTFDSELTALNLLNRYKIRNTANEVEYNAEALEFLSSLFRLPAYPSGYASEVFVALTTIARQNPLAFLQTIANYRSVIEVDVNRALTNGVITIDQGRAFFTDSNKLVMEFTSTSQAEKIDELIDFMGNPKNTLYNGQMRAGTKAKMIDATSKI